MQTLQAGQGQNADGLADACGVSRRTLFRDIESLREAGVPVQFDNGSGRYRIDSAHFLPPTNLTVEEALSLLVVLDQVDKSSGGPLWSTAKDALAKIDASLPASMRGQVRELASAVSVKSPSRNPLQDKGSVYHALLAAAAEKKAVSLHYDCQTECQEVETEFHPYKLLFHNRSWYAIGRSLRHESVRTFNVGRIKQANPLGKPFRVPRSFTMNGYLKNAWGLIPESGPDQVVHLRFSRLVAKNVSEVLWHKTQHCELAEDGSLDYHAQVSGLREIVWWILGYGDQVEVIKPQRLRRMVADRLRMAASKYNDDV